MLQRNIHFETTVRNKYAVANTRLTQVVSKMANLGLTAPYF